MRASKFLLQSIGEGSRDRRLVGVVVAHDSAEAEEGCDKASEMEQCLARGGVGVFLWTENTKNFVFLVNRLTKVPSLLLIPPAAIRVSVLTLHTGRVLVVVVLDCRSTTDVN